MVSSREARSRLATLIAIALCVEGCAPSAESPRSVSSPPAASRPSILLVTLDTTRADSIGPDAQGVETKAFNALVARGLRFTRAYATAPETLPAHASMMTGLYPAGHGLHENGRILGSETATVATRLQAAGYETAAFVSSFVLARRFGLARGFDTYDDLETAERSAAETTSRALAYLNATRNKPVFVWVHYFDAHAPYAPPEPFKTRFAKAPYLGEIAAVDEQLARLVAAFEQIAGPPRAIVVVGDHGEGLGDHGESQHGNLLYESTVRVPLVVVGPEVTPGRSDAPVSSRRVFHTLLDFAGLDHASSLRGAATSEVVLGEAMKPFLNYGWRPQVMAIDGAIKAIAAGRNEVYDVVADPAETKDLGAAGTTLSRATRTALIDYPIPSPAAARSATNMSDEDRRKLASLGYVSAGAAPIVRADAPRPVDMKRLFDTIETASALFVRGEYAKVLPLLERVNVEDPGNLDALLRLATAHSALGHAAKADQLFERARALQPSSLDVRLYQALHLARGPRWEESVTTLEAILAESPDRLPALEALTRLRERQTRTAEAIALWKRVHALRRPTAVEAVKVGELSMAIEDTPSAIAAFETARAMQGLDFRHNLELGVLYLAARRLEDARDALDRVSPKHPAYAMVLFKRAQVSVLLKEPDREARIERARRGADAATRELIARERLFQDASR